MKIAWKYTQVKSKFGGLVSKDFVFIDLDVATRFVMDDLESQRAYHAWTEFELQKEAVEILNENVIELIEEY